MSSISTTGHHNSRWLRVCHSVTRSGETSSLRLARPAADLNSGFAQHQVCGDHVGAFDLADGYAFRNSCAPVADHVSPMGSARTIGDVAWHGEP